ncbi:tRNA (adenosine(37)-N6)-threonylcarbamoyltransferase complex dimerization subunit type 1 TsaB [Anaerovorax odorimutans]|uniref:tRNA (adenosine(37)-N6)-threonylcarbamoyltransferase complex dimerization subunit type 1 TsaB n=1 Tax=Anaerovorax odorimutans TaxID=109327 RepID=UPI0003F824CA|nr:tRNA (adenosine(37)-N6)-threonylcarbamoyltransferase complex dimerization subunit type 1 TsaB [Anaerovorax odorimutans]
MNILAIETTGANASVAVINEQKEVFFVSSQDNLNHLQNLMPMIEKLLENCRLTLGDITCIAASEGPGSFTGIRIGVSSVRAMAQCLEINTISVPTLKSFAYNISYEYDGIVCPILDARRNQVYGGAYKWDEEGNCIEIIPASAYDLKDLLKKLMPFTLDNEITFFGDGIKPYEEIITAWSKELQDISFNNNMRIKFANDDIRLQNAKSVAKLAYDIYKDDGMKSFWDLKPVYMRKAEAQRKLEEKLNG